MKVVIDIPDGCYEELNNGQFPIQEAYRLIAWIKEGIQLPEKHGRLIDADAVKKRMIPLDFSVQKWISEVDLDIYIPTIIEAERKSKCKRCKDECKKEAEDKGIVMSDEKCKPCEYLYVCPYMMAEMNDIVEGN